VRYLILALETVDDFDRINGLGGAIHR